MRRTITGCLTLAFLCFLSAPALYADGTLLGTVSVRVLDQDGKALPGATAEVVSAEKGFQRSVTTDATGMANFPLLQPGHYTVKVSLAGFQSFESPNNVVAADKTTAVTATLKLAAAAESITVSGEAPLVDKTNMTATTVVSSKLTDKIPVGRGYQNLISFAPGVTDPANSGNPNSHGALGGNNLYLFDGVDTTDVTTGTFGQNFNFEAIQEVAVSTSGISAEYGRAQGAVVNVITKSGSNLFAGSVKVLATNDNWNEQNKGANPINGAKFARKKDNTNVYDYNYTLGGPIWKDHLWFFGSYENVTQHRPAIQTFVSTVHPDQTGQSAQPIVDVRLWDGKLSLQLTPSHLLVGQFNSDPITGFIVDYWGGSAELQALTAQAQNKCGGIGCLKQGSWSGVFGSKITGEARYAEQAGNITVGSFSGNGSPFFSFSDELYYNGATFNGLVDRPRKQANLAFSLYQDLFGSQHQFKVGADYQDLKSVADFHYPTNTLYYVSDYDPTKRANPVFVAGDIRQDFIAGPSVSKGKIWGLYALDKFTVGSHLSFNLGLRVEKQTSDSDIGTRVIDTTNLSPRVTGVYDVFGNGKTLASVAYGRYYQFLIQDIADSVFAGVPQEASYDQFVYDGTKFVFDKSVRVGGNSQPVNPDLKPSHLDEFNLSLQQQIGNTVAIGVRGIYRKWSDLVDDAKVLQAGNLVRTPRNFGDELKRYYKAIELTFEKRFSDRWQTLASYTLSRAQGNQFVQYTSQLLDYPGSNCTVTGVGTIPCTTAESFNQYGLASYDRTHIFRLFTSYTLPLGIVNLTAAPVFVYQSGLPYQRQRAFRNPAGGTYTYFIDQRGSTRLPSTYQVDFALEATFQPLGSTQIPLVAGPLELGIKGEIFNVTNQQQVVRNDRISLLPNQFFGAPTSRIALQAPRSYRLTALVRF